MVLGEVSLPLYRKTALADLTDKFGTCDKLPINVSVIPSERYSTSALPLAFRKGITAIELICPAPLVLLDAKAK